MMFRCSMFEMPKPPFCFAFLVCAALLAQAPSVSAVVQQDAAPKPLMLVTWFGPGGIPLPSGQEWKPELLTVYDKGTRPVAQFSNAAAKLSVSFIVFENLSGNPTAQAAAMTPSAPSLRTTASSSQNALTAKLRIPQGRRLPPRPICST
jgi:hypothetical protein